MVLTHIIVASPSNGEIAFRCDCDDEEVVDMGPLAGVSLVVLAQLSVLPWLLRLELEYDYSPCGVLARL